MFQKWKDLNTYYISIYLMEEVNVLEGLFDKKILKIVRLFLNEKENQFYLREISTKVNVPVATTFRIIKKLLKLSIIEEIKIKKFKLYKIKQGSNTKFLETFIREEKQILDIFTEKAKNIKGINSVILHGKEAKDRANILIIGESIDSNEIKQLCADIKSKYNFTISPLNLTEDQFKQMSSMGLYSGQKKVLYNK